MRPAAIQFWIARTHTLKISATSRFVYIGFSGSSWPARMASKSGYLGLSELLIALLHFGPGAHGMAHPKCVGEPLIDLETVDSDRRSESGDAW